MPSEKAHRVSERKRIRNRMVRKSTRTSLANARAELSSGSAEEAAAAVAKALAALDRAATKGVLHPNNAARRKSRLRRRLNALQAGEVEG